MILAVLNKMTEELIDVLNERGDKTGITMPREIIHKDGLWHASVQIWVYSPKRREVLLQKRSLEKKSYPGRFDISAAGHVDAGESVENAALREFHEELGIPIKFSDLEPIFIWRDSVEVKKGFSENEFQYVYLLEMDDLPTNIQKSELESVEFISFDKFMREIENPETAKIYVPHFYYPKLIAVLKTKMAIHLRKNSF